MAMMKNFSLGNVKPVEEGATKKLDKCSNCGSVDLVKVATVVGSEGMTCRQCGHILEEPCQSQN